jgi:Tfp pilus assembly major pilin PilA
MKKLGTLMAAALIFAGTATFAATPVHTAKAATAKTTTVNAKQQEKPKATTTPHAHKAHKKHHAKKAEK